MPAIRLAVVLLSILLSPVAFAQDHDKHMQMHGAVGAAAAPVAPDTRQTIVLTEDERNFVLAEMRGFLDSVQGIVEGVAEGNMKAVTEAARKSGMGTMQRVPRTLMPKMPPEFRMLGMNTHSAFDTLASESSGMGDTQVVLKQLATLLANCGACHQGYRLTAQ